MNGVDAACIQFKADIELNQRLELTGSVPIAARNCVDAHSEWNGCSIDLI